MQGKKLTLNYCSDFDRNKKDNRGQKAEDVPLILERAGAEGFYILELSPSQSADEKVI